MWLLLLGCAGSKAPADTDPPPTVAEACPRPAAAVAAGGDANGDGATDLADVLLIHRHVADGGPPPVCPDAVDLVPDGRVELDDGLAVATALYEGAFALPDAGDCAGTPGRAPPECGALALSVVAVDGGAEVRLAGSVPVEGWSLGLQPEGCTITSATTAGTHAAPLRSATPGRRDRGYDATAVVAGGAVSVVVLDVLDAVTLPAEATLLRVGLAPGEGCACTLRTTDGLAWLGAPVATLAVSGGAAWPLAAEASVDPCAGR